MKKVLLFAFLITSFFASSQQVTLKKGRIIDDLKVSDSLSESYALYLPKSFSVDKKWPIVFVSDMKGRARQAISMMAQAAEREGYILAGSNSLNDSLKLSDNILISSRMFNTIYGLLPIQKGRVYTAGFQEGGRLAALIPTFVKEVKGVISSGSAIPNREVLSVKNKFQFIGVVSNSDYNYPLLLNSKLILDKLKFQNQLIIYDGKPKAPGVEELSKALNILTLTAIKDGIITDDSDFVETNYRKDLGEVSALITSDKSLRAHQQLLDMQNIYHGKYQDSLKIDAKTLRKTKPYKLNARSLNNALFKENFLKDEYSYLVEEDALTYNYNNLGWWKYQMEELSKYTKSANRFEQQMGTRIIGYLNALIADNLDIVKADVPVDEEAVTFLWMMNTITDPSNATPYLKVISNSSRVEDYGTALFYLEELLKMGYANEEELYALEHTALLRITPEFNVIIKKYWKK